MRTGSLTDGSGPRRSSPPPNTRHREVGHRGRQYVAERPVA